MAGFSPFWQGSARGWGWVSLEREEAAVLVRLGMLASSGQWAPDASRSVEGRRGSFLARLAMRDWIISAGVCPGFPRAAFVLARELEVEPELLPLFSLTHSFP